MMSYQHHVIMKQTMMISCLHGVYTIQTPKDVMPCQLYTVGMEHKPHDIMLIWFTLYANLNDVTLGMHDMCVHMVNVQK